ncbi:MAG: HAMP domain-containing histidine kinase [Deltaproteobacteria bacterium]|nr:HAMP domain-containing histidine kinase [Deltaproteobacteria bacterium]
MSDRQQRSSNIRSTSARTTRNRGIQKLKDEFFSLAAHEIRTPITVIKAQAQLAERFYAQGKLHGELMERTLRTFVHESDRLARLCTDLLDVARLDSGCFEVHASRFDLVEMLRELIAKADSRCDIHRIDLDAPSPVEVWADRGRCQQVFSNLLNNAIRYSPRGGNVTVTVRSGEGGRATVAVRDQGVGISRDRLKNIFRRYDQGQQTGLRGPNGLGLGLYLCREALRHMGGNIRVKSAGAGLGSEFTFSLPMGSTGDE